MTIMPTNRPFPGRPNEPFFFGRGGRRMTPEDIALRRRFGFQQMQQGADYSPIASPWQGLARVAQGFAGGMALRGADKAEERNTAEREDNIARLLAYDPASGEPDPVAALLADPETSAFGMAAYKGRQTDPVEPVIQRANNGDILGLNPLTGEVMFQHADPNPKPSLDWLSVKNPDGTTTLVPIGVGGPITGGSASPPATLPPDFDFGEPTMENTPAPELGANGMPASLTREQYQAVVARMGQAATDAWAARNNIVVPR